MKATGQCFILVLFIVFQHTTKRNFFFHFEWFLSAKTRLPNTSFVHYCKNHTFTINTKSVCTGTYVTHVLPGPQRTLLECFRCFKLALSAVQSPQIPKCSGDCRTVYFCRLVPTAILAVRCVIFSALSVVLQR